MGNQKLKWKAEEEEALLAGIAKHGSGKWKNILRDPEFSDQLSHRSNIDLKDKWRNLNVAPNSQGSNYKARPTKVKEEGVTVAIVGADAAATTTPSTIDDSSSPPASSLQRSASSELINYDSCNTTVVDAKNAPRYDGMIFEALSTLADANGSDVSSIFHFIEPRHEVPANFRRTLSSRLRRLAGQCKLVKVSTSKSLQNFYKIPESSGVIRTVPAPAPAPAPTPKAPKPKETSTKPRQTHNQIPAVSREMVEEAAITAACKVVEAENKIDIAKLAVEESEKVNKLAEETELLLLIAKEIHEKCCRGEIVLLA